MNWFLRIIVGLMVGIVPSIAGAACAIALALTVDVSGSISEREYRLQMDGLAEALRNPAVVDALVSSEAALLLVQWSGDSRQVVSIEWSRMLSHLDVVEFADAAQSAPREWSVFSTGIGKALLFTAAQFGEVEDCERKVIDVSGDGYSNEGPDPAPIARELGLLGFQINGLTIEGNDFLLKNYYKYNVIAGEAAFVFNADTYEDYPKTIWRKLLSELIIPIS